MSKYDYIVVGSGLFGSVFARQAVDSGKSVLVIDRRSHIGGNVYTEDIQGIPVHKYGAHIFHTSQQYIWDYVNQFASFNNFSNRVKAYVDGRLYSLPINLFTMHQIWPDVITPADALNKLKEERININDPKNLEEHVLAQVGPTIYKMFIEGYTRKQWGRSPKELPSSIIKRLPIRLTMNDRYFHESHKWEGIPVGGYTGLIDNMLKGIEVRTGVDFLSDKTLLERIGKAIVYSGPLDQLFDYCEGRLEYRSLRFEHEVRIGDFQGNAVVNYCDESTPFTRILEHKHFAQLDIEHTIVTREYPEVYNNNEPYYPVNDEVNNKAHDIYKELASKLDNYIIGGRLANYRYYDMDMTVANALSVAGRCL
jgi:UDP-galactopyranose mutase